MKLLKKVSSIILGLSLAVGTFLPATTHAISDYEKRSKTLGGTTVSYIQDTVYIDTKCGSSAKAVFTASSPSPLSEIGIDYEVFGWLYPERVVDHQEILLENESRTSFVSKIVYDFYMAHADYTFKKSGSYWKPTGETFNCSEYTLKASDKKTSTYSFDGILEQANSFALDELEQAKSLASDKSAGRTSKDTTAKFLLDDQTSSLEEYGLTLDDLKLSKKPTVKNNVKEFEDEDTGIIFENKESSTFHIFNFKPMKVKKDGQEYEIIAYAVLDQTNKRIDKGLIINKLEE